MSFALAQQRKVSTVADTKTSASADHHAPILHSNNDNSYSTAAVGLAANSLFYVQRAIGNNNHNTPDSRSDNNNNNKFDCPRRINNNNSLQPKLKVSQPGDFYEQEADRIAEKVMSMPSVSFFYPASRPNGKATEGKEIDKKCTACESKGQQQEKIEIEISRKPSYSSSLEASDQVSNEIINNTLSSSSGSSLDSNTKEFMESRFGGGYDFSNVKIHTNERAVRSAESVNALAYTIGNNIVFGAGNFRPNTPSGRRLLAHELTHVIQQTSTDRLHLDHSDDKHARSPMAAVHPMIQRDPAPKEPARTAPVAVNLDTRTIKGKKRKEIVDHAVIIGTSTVTVGDLNIRFTGRMAVRGKATLTDVELPKEGAAAFVEQRVREQFKSAFDGAKVAGTSSKVELGLAGEVLILELAAGSELQPAFQVSGRFRAAGRTLKVPEAEVTNAALTLDITAWISPATSAANTTVGASPPPPSDASVGKFSFAGQDVHFGEKSGKKGKERTGSISLKSDMDAFETRVPKFVKEHESVKGDPWLKRPEQVAAFFQEMRAYFGSDDKTVDHFAKLKKVEGLKGASTILHEEAADRLLAVRDEIGEENMPESGGVGWPRSKSTMEGKQGIGNLHNIGFAIDYNAYQAPHIKDPRILDLITIVTGRSASLDYKTPAGLDTRAAGETFTRGSEEDKAKLDADKKVQTWLDQVEKEAAALGKASDDFRASLKTKDAAGAEVDQALRLQELRTKWFKAKEKVAAAKVKERKAKKREDKEVAKAETVEAEAEQKAIQDELKDVLKPWIEKVAAQKTAMEAKIAAAGLDPAKLPTGAKLEPAIKAADSLGKRIEALTGKLGSELKKGQRAQVDALVLQAKKLLEDTSVPPADDAAAIFELKRLGGLVAQRETALVQKKWLDRAVRLHESLLTGDPELVFGTKFRSVGKPQPGLAQLVDTGYFNLKGQAKAGDEAFGTDFVKSMVKHGFTHGGTWSTPDFMHFELRWKGPAG
jgi:Domain of unknown function (DUF4157)